MLRNEPQGWAPQIETLQSLRRGRQKKKKKIRHALGKYKGISQKGIRQRNFAFNRRDFKYSFV